MYPHVLSVLWILLCKRRRREYCANRSTPIGRRAEKEYSLHHKKNGRGSAKAGKIKDSEGVSFFGFCDFDGPRHTFETL